MANNPLQKSGLILVSDIMKEKEWLGTEAKTISALVEQNDRLSPYLILNTYNPLSIRTTISNKPYHVSDWYGYNHALTEDMTVLNGTITGGNMKSMVKTATESGSGLGFYANHYSVQNNLFSVCTLGSADNLSQGNTNLHVYNQFQVTERVTGSAGNYLVSVQRAYCEINLSTINSGRLIAGAEITLNGISNSYSPCRMILVKYENGSTWSTAGYGFYTAISEPVVFSTGDQTFTLNSLGVALINQAIVSADKYLRFGVITYEYDYLGKAYIGNSLLSGDDYDLDTIGHWVIGNAGSAIGVENAVTMTSKSAKVLKLTHTVGYVPSFKISASNFSATPAINTDYYFHCQYRFDDFPGSLNAGSFQAYTYTILNGKRIGNYSAGINDQFIRPQDSSASSTNWFRGHRHIRLNNPEFSNDGTLYFRIGGIQSDEAPGTFYMTDLQIVPILFSKIWGGKYDNPRLKFYYAGVPGTVSTGSASGISGSTATVGVTIASDGYTDIITSGICWNTGGNPTTSNNKTTDGNTNVSSFNATMTGLSIGTTYYVRAYVTTEVGTSYGSQITVSTLGVPVVTVQSASSIAATSVVLNANISSDGGSSVTSRGWYYKQGSVPTTSDSHLIDSPATGTGSMSQSLTGLQKNKTYYVKAFATNALGTALTSSSISFTTLSTLPTVELNTATNSGAPTSITFNGTVTDDGGHSITDRGFIYKAGGTPSISDNKTSATVPTGTGAFTKDITGLTPGTQYFFNAYATNEDGTAIYGTPGSFYTSTSAPTVSSTTAVTSITYNSASSGGNVSSDCGSPITQRGICWSTGAGPTTSNSKQTASGTTGSFSANLTGLSASTTYYVRAYAINAYGTAYGPQVSFTTSVQLFAPTVSSTTSVSLVTENSARSGGNVSSDGGSTITQRGVVYGTSQNPTIANSKVVVSGTTGSFTADMTGLAASTTYYVRAFATNAIGTTYASQQSFTTQAAVTLASVTTTTPSQVLTNAFWVGCNVTDQGNSTVTEKGVVINTSGNPTTSSYIFKNTSGSGGTGYYDVQKSGLPWSTTYYVRGYAINGVGTSYGAQLSFTTGAQPTAPILTNNSPSSITGSSAYFSGSVTGDGGGTVSERGFVYSNIYSTPTTSNATKLVVGSGTGSFATTRSGLSSGTTYYVCSYAINEGTTGYGTMRSFTTDSAPAVTTTSPASSITASSATVSGNVSSDGGSTVTARGICYSTSQNPTTSNNVATSGSGTGSFSSSLSGLGSSTTYYARAYATNSVGTSYGSQISFTTSSGSTVPSVSTGYVIERMEGTKYFDTLDNQVVSDGGSSVTARGICYSLTNSTPTLSDSVVAAGSGTGYFDATALSGFGNYTVYWRAYATNSMGTAYGSVNSFYKDGISEMPPE